MRELLLVCGHMRLRCRDCGFQGNQCEMAAHTKIVGRMHNAWSVVTPVCAGDDNGR